VGEETAKICHWKIKLELSADNKFIDSGHFPGDVKDIYND